MQHAGTTLFQVSECRIFGIFFFSGSHCVEQDETFCRVDRNSRSLPHKRFEVSKVSSIMSPTIPDKKDYLPTTLIHYPLE